jgi:hypothetical protein
MLEVVGDFVPSLDQTDMTSAATVVAFDSEGRAVGKTYFDTPNKASIAVERGTYDVLLFNGLMYSGEDTHLDGVTFRGIDRFETFEAVAKEGSLIRRLGTRADDEFIASNEMEIVTSALWGKETVTESREYYVKYKNGENGYVTPPNYVYADSLLTPAPVSYVAQLLVKIKNISSVAGASAALYGFVGSAYMSSRMPNSQFPVTHQFNLNNRQWIDQSQNLGTIESPEFVTFGPPLDDDPNHKYEVYIKMVLVDGKELEFTFDDDYLRGQMAPIVEEIKANHASQIAINYKLEIPLEIDLTHGEIPETEPVEGGVGIGGWGDDELITVPITP